MKKRTKKKCADGGVLDSILGAVGAASPLLDIAVPGLGTGLGVATSLASQFISPSSYSPIRQNENPFGRQNGGQFENFVPSQDSIPFPPTPPRSSTNVVTNQNLQGIINPRTPYTPTTLDKVFSALDPKYRAQVDSTISSINKYNQHIQENNLIGTPFFTRKDIDERVDGGNYNQGGVYPRGTDEQLSSDSFRVDYPGNATDGKTYGDYNLDKNEVVDMKGFVYSDEEHLSSVPDYSPADLANPIKKAIGKAEKKLKSNPTDTAAKNTIDMSNKILSDVALNQELLKQVMGLQDHDTGDKKTGGGIHIKKENRGKFTKKSKAHGKSVQAFANQVLANKSNYSSATVKQATFAHNAARWNHALGGFLDSMNMQNGGTMPQFNLPPVTVTAPYPEYPVGNINLPTATVTASRQQSMMPQTPTGEYTSAPAPSTAPADYMSSLNRSSLPLDRPSTTQFGQSYMPQAPGTPTPPSPFTNPTNWTGPIPGMGVVPQVPSSTVPTEQAPIETASPKKGSSGSDTKKTSKTTTSTTTSTIPDWMKGAGTPIPTNELGMPIGPTSEFPPTNPIPNLPQQNLISQGQDPLTILNNPTAGINPLPGTDFTSLDILPDSAKQALQQVQKDPNLSDTEKQSKLSQLLQGLGVGDYLQMASLIPYAATLFGGSEKFSTNLERTRQIDTDPIASQLRQAFTGQIRGQRSGSYNINQAQQQNAYASYYDALRKTSTDIANQNKQLAAQTERFNIGQMDRTRDMNAASRARYRDAWRTLSQTIGNLGMAASDRQTNENAAKYYRAAFPDVQQFLMNELNKTT